VLLEDLAAEIEKKVPLGADQDHGHVDWRAPGLCDRASSTGKWREIAGICVVDFFMIETSKPTAGQQGRAIEAMVSLVADGWKLILNLLGRVSASGGMNSIFAADAVAKHELGMRVLIGHLAPWLVALDREPLPLMVPVALLRIYRNSSGTHPGQFLREPCL
jgi:hypothetical protein